VRVTVGDGLSSIPAGWYPDPADAARLRRWDGQGWTSDVAPASPPPPRLPPPPVFADPAPPPPPPARVRSPAHAAVPIAPADVPPVQSVPAQQQPVVPAQAFPTAAPAMQPSSPLAPSRPAAPEEPPPNQDASESHSAPDWMNLPGLTLPPDLTAIIGPERDAILPLPRFEPRFEVRAAPEMTAAPAAPAAPVMPPASAEPYAPPPSGMQYDAPPPPGVSYTPPPGVAQAPALLGAPTRYTNVMQAPPSASQYVPMARSSTASLGVTEANDSATAGVWLIAVLPLLHFVVVYAIFGVLATPFVPGIQWGIVAAPAVFSLIFAAADRRKLLDLGHGSLASAVWAVLPPLYLLVRCFRVGGISVVTLLVWVVLQAAAVVGVLILLPTVLAAAIAAS